MNSYHPKFDDNSVLQKQKLRSMSHKVLMFGWEFPPYNSGGLGVACLGLTKALVTAGVEVSFVLPRKMDLAYNYMRFIYADTSLTINKENYQKYQFLLGAYNGFDLQSWENISLHQIKKDLNTDGFSQDIYAEVMRYTLMSEEIIKKEYFDSIHCHDWLTIQPGILAKQYTGKPLFFHIHATEFDRTGGHVNQLIYDIERKGMNIADKVITVSNFTKKTIEKHYGISPEKIEVVHNGIDYYLEKTEAKDNELIDNLRKLKKLGRQIVLYTGRLTFQKGLEYFLQAIKLVSNNLPSCHSELIEQSNGKSSHLLQPLFVIAGSGDMQEKLLDMTAQLGLSDKVIFAGFVRDERLKSLYAEADLFVMPSISEPFGLVALEAMVHNTPVILSKNSGVQELLSHALKVDFWDTHQMAHLILTVLQNPALAKTLTDYGHNEVQNLSWDQSASKILGLYQKHNVNLTSI